MEKKINSLGVMLDCSRNAVMTVEQLKKFMSLLATMGYNRFMLYTEDTYEVEGEEFFGYFRGRYSLNELKELDDFASSQGIELIPCIQTLAHLKTLIRWKKYSEFKDCDDILLVGDERTYKLINNMFKTLRSCFKTDKIHIGMDEAHNLGKGKYRDINGEKDKTEILLEHLGKVCQISADYGFKPMMWSDMFYRIAAGGEYYATDTEFDSTIKSKIPSGLTLVYWDYYHIEKELYDKMLSGHKQLTDDIAFAGGGWKWSGWTPHNTLSIMATKMALSSCIQSGVKDAFITLWGDDGSEGSAYAMLPTLCVAACIAQGITDEKEIKDRFFRWTGADYDTFMLLDLPDYQEGVNPDYVINPSKYQLYNDCFMGIYDNGGVCEGDGENYRHIAEKLKENINKTGNYRYLFDTIIALCDVLAIKAEIGIRTRKTYKDNNFEEVKKIIAEYEIMIKNTERLYAIFEKQWFEENKGQGFEVQDIRFGGLIARMKSCKNRLVKFSKGEITRIEELDEEPLPLIEKKELINVWKDTVTANVL